MRPYLLAGHAHEELVEVVAECEGVPLRWVVAGNHHWKALLKIADTWYDIKIVCLTVIFSSE